MKLRGGVVLASTICVALLTGAPAQAEPTIVGTQQGQVEGRSARNVRSFLGLPFAAPPVGALRWRPPQPPAPWGGVRQAAAAGPRCAQLADPISPLGSTSEDCLYLNVYSPAGEASGLPVIVWLHGGGWVFGAGSDYDPTELVAREHVVVV